MDEHSGREAAIGDLADALNRNTSAMIRMATTQEALCKFLAEDRDAWVNVARALNEARRPYDGLAEKMGKPAASPGAVGWAFAAFILFLVVVGILVGLLVSRGAP